MRLASAVAARLAIAVSIPALLGAAVTLPGVFADEPPAQQASSVFPSGADLVRLDMVARTKDGRVVTDLRSDEVQVFEDGKPVAVSSFRYVQAELEAAAAKAPAPGGSGATAPERAPAASSTPVETGSLIALVFDQLSADSAPRARAAALDMLKRPFPKRALLAVFKTGQGLRVVQTFTGDRALLPAAVERATTGLDRALETARRGGQYENATEEALATALQAAGGGARGMIAGVAPPGPAPRTQADIAMLQLQARMLRFDDLITRESRGNGSVAALMAIARGLATVDGRKTLLYFSEGLDVPPAVDEVYRTMVSAANRSNLSIYSFDARGLSVRSPNTEAHLATELAAVQGGSPTSGRPADDAILTALDGLRLNRQGTLRDLAESTGGFLVAETNDLRPGLDRVAADLRSYYELAYAPPEPKADGRWRTIEVKVARPGVTIRTRKGYFAFPPGAPIVRPSELPLFAALETKPLPRQVELRGAVLRLVDDDPAPEALVLVEAPLAAAALQRDEAAGLWRARLELLGLVKDDKGELVARLSHDAPLEGPLAELATAQQGTLTVRRSLRLKPGRYTLETAVRDVESGRVGAQRTAFDVPAADAGLRMGSVVVARADEAAGEAASAAANPLRAGKLQASPLLGKPAPAGTRAISLFLSIRPVAGGPAPTLDVEFRREGRTVARAAVEALPPADASGRVAFIGSFPIVSFEPGRYEVLARAHQGDAEAVEGASFTLVGSAAGAARNALPPGPSAGGAPAGAAAAVADAEARAPRVVDAPADVRALLAKAGEYVAQFQETFRNVVAEETYRQWAGSQVRTLRSDLVFATVPAEMPFATFRDVFEVNGQKVRDRDARLESLFRETTDGSFERANAILRESARFNLGPLYRTVNVPTLALALLRPDHQWRFRWEKRGSRRFSGHDGIELHAEETARPTLVHERSGADLPVEAWLWVEAGTGRVLRTETVFRTRINATLRPMQSWITTQYRPEPSLGLWVPEEMFERYEDVPFAMREDMEKFDGTINARARYANHRRFSVEVESGPARAPAAVQP